MTSEVFCIQTISLNPMGSIYHISQIIITPLEVIHFKSATPSSFQFFSSRQFVVFIYDILQLYWHDKYIFIKLNLCDKSRNAGRITDVGYTDFMCRAVKMGLPIIGENSNIKNNIHQRKVNSVNIPYWNNSFWQYRMCTRASNQHKKQKRRYPLHQLAP